MNNIRRQRRWQRTERLLALFVITLVWSLCQPKLAAAQQAWTSDSIAKAAAAIAAHSRNPRKQSSQSKSGAGGKGDVTIQTITAGKIAKFTNGSGAIEDSIIAESNGNIGIGITAPGAKLQIDTASGSGTWGNAIADGLIMRHTNTVNGLQIMHGGSTAFFAVNPDALGSGALGIGTRGALPFPIYFYTGAGILNGTASTTGLRMTIDGSGNVGIGTTTPNRLLHLRDTSPTPVFTGSRISTPDGSDPAYELLHETANKGFRWRLGWGATSNLSLDFTSNGFGSYSEYLTVLSTGSVGIGTSTPSTSNKLHVAGNAYVTGNLVVDGNLAAKYQDVAEWVPAKRAMPAGTVVTLDPEHSNLVVASSHSYDTRVAGVVSEKPGVILGEGGDGKVMVATTGRVRVKVDATNGPIRVGDLLVTSDKEGIAMRSQPLDLGGTPIHRPGTLIGKALEPLEKGLGEILVLLSLQ